MKYLRGCRLLDFFVPLLILLFCVLFWTLIHQLGRYRHGCFFGKEWGTCPSMRRWWLHHSSPCKWLALSLHGATLSICNWIVYLSWVFLPFTLSQKGIRGQVEWYPYLEIMKILLLRYLSRLIYFQILKEHWGWPTMFTRHCIIPNTWYAEPYHTIPCNNTIIWWYHYGIWYRDGEPWL